MGLHQQLQSIQYVENLETVNSSGAPLIYGNDLITADIQNLYTEKENCFYVAASSLPSYTLN